jgi:hypothetical protein
VCHIDGVKIFDTLCDLLKNPPTLRLWDAPLRVDILAIVVKGNALHILGN